MTKIHRLKAIMKGRRQDFPASRIDPKLLTSNSVQPSFYAQTKTENSWLNTFIFNSKSMRNTLLKILGEIWLQMLEIKENTKSSAVSQRILYGAISI